MAKLEWVDTSFDREFYTRKLSQIGGQVYGAMASLDIAFLAERLNIPIGVLQNKLTELGYFETGKTLEELSVDMYGKSKYRLRPGIEEYPERVDCSSFVCGVYAEFGVELPRYTIQQVEIGWPVEIKLPEVTNFETGDLLFFDEKIRYKWKSESGIEVSHVMLYLGNGRVADASVKNKPNAIMVRDVEEVVNLGRKHVATRRYIKDFARLVHYENRTGQLVEDFEDLSERLINNNDDEK